MRIKTHSVGVYGALSLGYLLGLRARAYFTEYSNDNFGVGFPMLEATATQRLQASVNKVFKIIAQKNK